MSAAVVARVLTVMMAAAVVSVGTLWLAGFFFFLLSKADPIGATNLGTWWLYWKHYGGDPAVRGRLLGGLGIAAGVTLTFVGVLVAMALQKRISLHGDARFATQQEVASAGLFGDAGIMIGRWGKRYLMFGGMQFVLLCAPTRSGKGVSVVIPNLLSWQESLVCTDVKLENFLITSKFRAKYSDVYLFNPFNLTDVPEGDRPSPMRGRSHRYNPLGYISDDPRLRVSDALAIGYALYPGVGKDAFWDDQARNLFMGLVLYLCETPSLPRTMGELLRQSSGKGKPAKDHLNEIITARNYVSVADVKLTSAGDGTEEAAKALDSGLAGYLGVSEDAARALCVASLETGAFIATDVPEADLDKLAAVLKGCGAEGEVVKRLVPRVWEEKMGGEPPLSMECVDALMRFIAASENTLANIMSSFNAPLTLWASPMIDAATSANDFDLRQVRRRRMTIYIGVPANKLAECRVLLNLFYSQLVTLNTDALLHSSPGLKYQCLLLNDEFTAPGRIAAIDTGNSFMAGYGLRLVTIIQARSQLLADAPKGYGKEGGTTLATNHACQIFFTPREKDDANEYSETLGYYTFKAKGSSRQLTGRTGRSESISDQRRALMMPQELREMPQREQIITMENTKAIKCEKIAYYDDPMFLDRLKSVSPSLASLGKKKPTRGQLEAAWGSGEMAAMIPVVDLDVHEAKVQDRVREATAEEVAGGIRLERVYQAAQLEAKFAKAAKQGDPISAEDADALVTEFWETLGGSAASGEDDADADADAGESISDEELAALDAAIAQEDAAEAESHAAHAAPAPAVLAPVSGPALSLPSPDAAPGAIDLKALYASAGSAKAQAEEAAAVVGNDDREADGEPSDDYVAIYGMDSDDAPQWEGAEDEAEEAEYHGEEEDAHTMD